MRGLLATIAQDREWGLATPRVTPQKRVRRIGRIAGSVEPLGPGGKMTKFSPSEAALEGFRLSREQPSSIIIWSILYFAGTIALGLAFNVLAGPEFTRALNSSAIQKGDPAAYAHMFGRWWPAFIIITMVWTLFNSVLTGGIFRMALRPGEKGVAHLQFGKTEFRLAAVSAILGIIGLFCIFTTYVLTIILAKIAGGPLGIISGFMLFAGVIWIGLRLMLVTPMTFEEEKISLAQAWHLSKGHELSLLFMSILSIVFWIILVALLNTIGLAFISLGGGIGTILHPSHFRPLSALALLVSFYLQALMSTLWVVMFTSPLAVAYRELKVDDAWKVGIWAKP